MFQEKLASVPFCKGDADDSGGTGSGLQQVFGAFDPKSAIDGYKFDCKDAVGYLAVYRLDFCFSTSIITSRHFKEKNCL
jgi:hypothetical protein